MRYKLFLDDERYPPASGHDDWKIARNMHDAVWYVKTYGLPYYISFDHDLGNQFNLSGMDFTRWFCDHILDNSLDLPDDFTYYVHSQNPVGAKNIDSYMANFLKDGYI